MPSLMSDRDDSRTEMNLLSSHSENGCGPKTHLHVCASCGHTRRREQVSTSEIGTGVFHCPNCDAEGPLNVEIRRSEKFEEMNFHIA